MAIEPNITAGKNVSRPPQRLTPHPQANSTTPTAGSGDRDACRATSPRSGRNTMSQRVPRSRATGTTPNTLPRTGATTPKPGNGWPPNQRSSRGTRPDPQTRRGSDRWRSPATADRSPGKPHRLLWRTAFTDRRTQSRTSPARHRLSGRPWRCSFRAVGTTRSSAGARPAHNGSRSRPMPGRVPTSDGHQLGTASTIPSVRHPSYCWLRGDT